MMLLLFLGSAFCVMGCISLAVWGRLSPVHLLLFVVGSFTGCITTAVMLALVAQSHPLTHDPGASSKQMMGAAMLGLIMLAAEISGLLAVWLKCKFFPPDTATEEHPGLTPTN